MSETVTTTPAPKAPVKSRRGRRALALILAMLVALLGLSSFLLYRLLVPSTGNSVAKGDEAGGINWVRSIYGTSENPADQLDRTQAAVTAPDGSLWVTDSVHRSLMHFTADGRYIGAITGPKDAPLLAPSRFTIGPDGLLYVVETNSDVIRVLTQTGRDAGSFGVPGPVSVAVSRDRIVVGSVNGFAIVDKATKDPIKVIGTRGKGKDQFDYVHGVAIGENGTVYVADSFNNRLSAYDKNGTRLWIVRTGAPTNSAKMVNDSLAVTATADAKLKGEDALQLPLGITLDGSDRIVVSDMFDSTLAVFNAKDGSFVGKYGEVGAEDGQFFYPVSVAYDPAHDWFTVADSLSNRIEIVRIPGSSNADGGAAASAAIKRTLAGPLRALVLPLALVVLAAIAMLIIPAVMRRRRTRAASAPAAMIAPEQ